MGRKNADWREQPIDPKIRPLVDALNQTGRVQTIASCEGHFWRTSDPYVYFRCTPTVAEALAHALDKIRWSGVLNHYWTLQGVFDTNHRLAFTLRSEALSHDRSLITTFWRYIAKRHHVDADLAVLARRLPDALEHLDGTGDLPRVLEPSSQADEDKTNEQKAQPIAPAPLPKRILRLATRANAPVIRRKFSPTDVARAKLRHNTTPFARELPFEIPRHDWGRKC